MFRNNCNNLNNKKLKGVYIYMSILYIDTNFCALIIIYSLNINLL